MQRAAGATERLLELVHSESAITDTATPATLDANPAMAFNKVSFSYPSRPQTRALDDVTLEIAAGKSLALVGPSGAGKSTIFEVIQRFYDPQGGSVTLDGIDIREIPLEQLRAQLAIVPQQPTLFSADVRYNIAYGRPDASDADIEAAARRAHPRCGRPPD